MPGPDHRGEIRRRLALHLIVGAPVAAVGLAVGALETGLGGGTVLSFVWAMAAGGADACGAAPEQSGFDGSAANGSGAAAQESGAVHLVVNSLDASVWFPLSSMASTSHL